MATLNSSIFQSIKGALAQEKSNNSYGDILKMVPGNTYTVRLLPAKDPKQTFFHFFQHGWMSFATGSYVGALSLQTFGERDPIAEERYRLIKTGTEEQKAKADTVRRAEKWLVNVYVVNDPTTPENNGKVKIVRYGKQLHTVILDAIEGESAEDFGPRVFDLSATGVSLRIKCDKQGDFPSFVASKFSLPGEIKDLNDEKIAKIYDSVHDLTKIMQSKSVDELKAMFNEHFHAKPATDLPAPIADEPVSEKTESAPVAAKVAKKKEPAKTTASTENDEEVEKLLAGLDIN